MGAPVSNWRRQGKSFLRSARAAVARIVSPPADTAFRPDYSDAVFVAMLAATAADAATGTREALAAWQAGAPDRARQITVNHFDARTHCRFFFDTIDASALATAISRTSSGWEDRLARWTTAVTTEALEVYGRPAAPLKPGFPWGGDPFVALDDILFPARPHRFAFAPTLACATLTGRFPAEQFRALLADWCRFAAGDGAELAFVSNLVASQRLIACSWAYALLGPAGESAPPDRRELKWQLLKVMSQDVAYLKPRIGRSYPNNHLLVDRFVAWYIATLFPELGFDRAMQVEAEGLWLRECENQIYPDGGYFEPSTHYHGLAAELLTGYVLLARRQGRHPSERVEAWLEAMLRFQASITGRDGHPGAIGDGTEDQMFPLTAHPGSARALSALYRILFGGEASASTEFDPSREWAFWMLGGAVLTPEKHWPPPGFAAFPDAGIFVFSEQNDATRLVLRTAPAPERRVMPGHMHSDLMSICFVESGTPLIVDSGTFSYRFRARGAPNWRAYFAGASAHNTVLVGDQDPLGPVTGDFRSARPTPRATLLGCRASARLAVAAARLDGRPPYAGLVRGVVHVRDEYFLIWSELPDGGSKARFPFQLASGTEVQVGRGRLKLSRSGTSTALVYSSELEPEPTRQGSRDPIAGWVSPRYGEMVPAPQIAFRATGGSRFSAVLLRRDERPPVSSIACEEIADGARAIRVESAGFSDLVVLNLGRTETPVSVDRASFAGEALWVRESADGSVAMRSLATRAVRLPERGIELIAAGQPEDFDYPVRG